MQMRRDPLNIPYSKRKGGKLLIRSTAVASAVSLFVLGRLKVSFFLFIISASTWHGAHITEQQESNWEAASSRGRAPISNSFTCIVALLVRLCRAGTEKMTVGVVRLKWTVWWWTQVPCWSSTSNPTVMPRSDVPAISCFVCVVERNVFFVNKGLMYLSGEWESLLDQSGRPRTKVQLDEMRLDHRRSDVLDLWGGRSGILDGGPLLVAGLDQVETLGGRQTSGRRPNRPSSRLLR